MMTKTTATATNIMTAGINGSRNNGSLEFGSLLDKDRQPTENHVENTADLARRRSYS